MARYCFDIGIGFHFRIGFSALPVRRELSFGICGNTRVILAGSILFLNSVMDVTIVMLVRGGWHEIRKRFLRQAKRFQETEAPLRVVFYDNFLEDLHEIGLRCMRRFEVISEELLGFLVQCFVDFIRSSNHKDRGVKFLNHPLIES